MSALRDIRTSPAAKRQSLLTAPAGAAGIGAPPSQKSLAISASMDEGLVSDS